MVMFYYILHGSNSVFLKSLKWGLHFNRSEVQVQMVMFHYILHGSNSKECVCVLEKPSGI